MNLPHHEDKCNCPTPQNIFVIQDITLNPGAGDCLIALRHLMMLFVHAMQGPKPYETVFVARQPIFDKELSVWGYQVLYRSNEKATAAAFTDALEATLKVMTNVTLCPSSQPDTKQLLVSFDEEAILINAPLALPPANTVILVKEEIEASRTLLNNLHDLRGEGYQIMVGDFSASPGKVALYRTADILAIDFRDKTPEVLGELTAEAEQYGAQLMARRIETHEEHELAKFMGFSLFQGYFFKQPNVLSTRKPSASDAAKLRLFYILKNDSPDYDLLAETIEADVSISYRLLALLNSPTFGFLNKVSSIRQAVLLLGWKQIKHWLRLVILTDLTSPDKTFELAFLSAQRARFLELCAKLAKYEDTEPMFLLGLFSLLEAIMDLPMANLLDHLFLEDSLKGALCGEENDYTPWLQLVESVEQVDWKQLDAMLETLGLNVADVEQCYHQAIAWANDFFCTTQ